MILGDPPSRNFVNRTVADSRFSRLPLMQLLKSIVRGDHLPIKFQVLHPAPIILTSVKTRSKKKYQQLENLDLYSHGYSHEFLKFYHLRRRASGRLGKVVSQCQAQATTWARKQTFINLRSVGDFLTWR